MQHTQQSINTANVNGALIRKKHIAIKKMKKGPSLFVFSFFTGGGYPASEHPSNAGAYW